MSSDVFWKSPPCHHLNAAPQVNCSTRLQVHWQQNSCRRRLSVCAEQTAGARWLIADVNGRSSTCSTQTGILWRRLKTRTAVLNLILCRTGSQWNSHITAVMSNFLLQWPDELQRTRLTAAYPTANPWHQQKVGDLRFKLLQPPMNCSRCTTVHIQITASVPDTHTKVSQ